MTDKANITQARAAQRFSQIATLERLLCLKLAEVTEAKAHAKELQEEADGLMLRLLCALCRRHNEDIEEDYIQGCREP